MFLEEISFLLLFLENRAIFNSLEDTEEIIDTQNFQVEKEAMLELQETGPGKLLNDETHQKDIQNRNVIE